MGKVQVVYDNSTTEMDADAEHSFVLYIVCALYSVSAYIYFSMCCCCCFITKGKIEDILSNDLIYMCLDSVTFNKFFECDVNIMKYLWKFFMLSNYYFLKLNIKLHVVHVMYVMFLTSFMYYYVLRICKTTTTTNNKTCSCF